MYRDNEPTLEGNGRVLADALATAIPELPKGIYRAQRIELTEPTLEQSVPAPDYVKPNAYCLHDGLVCIREGTVLRPLNDLPSETRAPIRGLIPVRDAVRDCLRAQLDGSSEERVLETRTQRSWVTPCLVLVSSSRATRQGRLVAFGSEAARYVRAIWRLS